MKKTQQGFTLIEVLITLAIVGIMAKIAYPSYVASIQQSKRADAKAALVSFANAMEMWKMQNNNSYLGAATSGDTGAPKVFSAVVPVSGGTKTYDLTIDVATATAYTLKATPVSADSTCGNLTLTNTGVKAPATCW